MEGNPMELLTGNAAIEARRQRGMEIAAVCPLTRKGGNWVVPSMSGNGRYTVTPDSEKPTCTCPDFEARGCRCKHIFAVEFAMRRETTQNADGSMTVTETIAVKATKRTTYAQDWPAYNKAQTNEQDHFQILLRDLCAGIHNAPQQGKGRPRLPLSDVTFAAVFKVYSTFSGRRFVSDLRAAHERGHIRQLPHYNSIFKYLEDPDLTPILNALIAESSKPLASVESDFAIDSTGFASSRFIRWYDHKYNVVRQDHDWCKAHFICGVNTNVVTAVEIHERNASDTPQLPSLLDATAKNFNVRELSADKAYASVDNFAALDRHNVTPYVAFKSHHTGAAGGLFEKAYHFFSFNRETFLAHYHKRSNVESTVMMIKTKFGDAVRSKTDTAMKNEALCKVLCHNIVCLVSAFYELGIGATFWQPAAN
jgi:transposase